MYFPLGPQVFRLKSIFCQAIDSSTFLPIFW